MKGDIIYVVRKPIGIGSFELRRTSRSGKLDQLIARTYMYRHYGIEVEDNYVIHFVGDSIHYMHESLVKRTSMEEFLKDGIKRVDSSITYEFNKEQVIKRAYSCLNTDFGGYNIYKNNCEHFVFWCATGIKQSSQSDIMKRSKSFVIKYPKLAKDKLISLLTVL